jgi:hypothetical protein
LPFGEHHAIDAEQFAKRPCLERTASGRERSLGVGDLRHVTQTSPFQMFEQWRDKPLPRFTNRCRAIRPDSDPRVNEGPQ